MPASKKRILFADDNEDSLALLSAFLEAGEISECELTVAKTWNEVMRLAADGGFDLYLLDLTLSDGSGLSFIQQIKSLDQSVPVIVYSGDTRSSTREVALQAGAQAFFGKPVEYDELIETIKRLIG